MLAQYSHLITEGNIVRVVGRLSTSEEQDTKLICEAVFEAPDKNGEMAQSSKERKNPPGLYLKVNSKEDMAYKKAMQYIAIFDGTMPLHIYFKDEKKLFHAPVSQRVDVNQPLDVYKRQGSTLYGNWKRFQFACKGQRYQRCCDTVGRCIF